MAEATKKWGRGRIVFMAELPAIRAEISRALPLTEVFASRADRLGIGYSAFTKLVSKYAADAKITRPTVTEPAENASTKGTTDVSSRRKAFSDHTGHADPAILRKLVSG